VDFILGRAKDRVAIEVKSGANLSERSFRGLRAVAQVEGMRRRMVVYLGERRQATQDGIEILPLRDFLDLLEGDRLFRGR
jgi:predicted AAA+ superfamily ATPase